MKKSSRQLFYFLIVLILLTSCSVEKNRKLLSVFFDGVPSKIEKEVITTEKMVKDSKNIKTVFDPIKSSHPDFKSRNCSKCHTKSVSNFLKTDRKKICFSCHKEDKFTGPYVHGPVAVRACNNCHDPHQSVNEKLLLEKGKQLCSLCHRVPITGDSLPCRGDNCLECHEPHVSSNKYFLKNSDSSEKIGR